MAAISGAEFATWGVCLRIWWVGRDQEVSPVELGQLNSFTKAIQRSHARLESRQVEPLQGIGVRLFKEGKIVSTLALKDFSNDHVVL